MCPSSQSQKLVPVVLLILPLPFTAVASLIAVRVSYNCCKETFEAFEGKPGMILLGA